ncbi:hypothetical protein GCM10023231_00620 [Olivibacter ginsenosidimutans]|uniref:XRE family transcriptional regulator n=1 Tax=Olivibacter ginsenosidimutans TaxID=1176537 RepID=A0ABP9AED4_9SPHI
MDWKENLKAYLDKSGKTDIEIHSFTNIPPSTLSKIRNKKTEKLSARHFHLLKLFFGEKHLDFLNTIFDINSFDIKEKVSDGITRTSLGKMLHDNYHLEKLTLSSLAEASEVKRERVKYLNYNDDSSISTEELTKIELALGEKPGTLFKKVFKSVKLNSVSKANKLVEEARAYNAKSNDRRKTR